MQSPTSIGFNAFAASTGDVPALWGQDPVQVHDHFWRQVGVTVVRPGGSQLRPGLEDGVDRARRPGRRPTFLLLGLDELAAFAPAIPLRRLRQAMRARSIVVGLHAPGDTGYVEEIDADEHDQLVAVRRTYGAPNVAGSVVLTRDARLAEWWRRSVHPARHPRAETAVERIRTRRRPRTMGTVAAGVLEEVTDAAGVGRWAEAMMRLDSSLAGTIPGVGCREPGVWVHESARIGTDVSLAGPLWIGQNVIIEGNTALVGPQMLSDGTGTMPGRSGVNVAGRRMPAPAGQSFRSVPARDFAAAQRMSSRIDPGPEPRGVRLFNVAVSGLALAMVAPLFPLIMLSIWLEDGRPFFFGHARQTRGGRRFTCWKFRTMCRNAETMKAELERENVCDGPQFHIADDPRLLKIGKFLRRFHLDELPQLWNVFSGDMNLVGPRPSPDDENQYCPAWREVRLSVNPGLTGLWQIRRTRAPLVDFQEWIRWDLEYVHRRSWRLDLWIMWRTAVSIVSGRGSAPIEDAAGVDERGGIATLAGFNAPAITATAATAVVFPARRTSGSGRRRRLDTPLSPSRLVELGLDDRLDTADDNARAVERAAADERAATIARTTLDPAEELAADIAGGPTETDVDIPRRDGRPVGSEIEAKPRRPESNPGRTSTGDVEAKPAQPNVDADAVGDRNVEAKPGEAGETDPELDRAAETFEDATGDDPHAGDRTDRAGPGEDADASADGDVDEDDGPDGGRRAA